MKKIKHCVGFLLLLSVMLMLPFSQSHAATNSQKAKMAYGKFLKNHESKYQSFAVINIGSKKEPVLLVNEDGVNDEGTTIYGKLYYYTGSKVKAVKGGDVGSSGTAYPLQYIKHSLFVGTRWGLGSMIKVKKGCANGTSVYAIYNYGEVQNYYKATIKKGKIVKSSKKVISEKTYKAFEKKWNPYNSKKNRTIKMKWNNAYNRKLYTGFEG